jgi:CheY-like chemotaxis protein
MNERDHRCTGLNPGVNQTAELGRRSEVSTTTRYATRHNSNVPSRKSAFLTLILGSRPMADLRLGTLDIGLDVSPCGNGQTYAAPPYYSAESFPNYLPATFEYMPKDPTRRTATILIVEDTDWIRSGMKQAAEQCGYQVAEAKDELEAVEFAEHQPPDLILTEERLPDFSALVARVNEHPVLQQIPIVIIDPDAVEEGRVGDVFVLKDYDRIAPFLVTPPDRN